MNALAPYNFFRYLPLFFGLLVFTSACKTAKVDTDSSSIDKPLENALLWEISGNDLSTPSYLFGTIHIIGSEDYFLPKGTLSAIESSNKMMFEIDMNEMTDMSAQMSMLSKAFMKDGLTLKDLLNEEDYKVVEEHFKKIGMPLFLFERIKPMFLSVFAMGDFDVDGLQSGSMKSYEMEFMEMANQTQKSTGGLESIEFQISVFDSIPYTDQADMLVSAIKESDGSSDQFKEMTTMYKTQNITAMVSAIEDDPSGMGDYDDILLKTRNENWIPIMATEMKSQATFFAVGAGHLAGKYGVIPLLRQAGYTLKPLSHVQ
jgi:uncharacterized protein YbaP (TraB family)